MSFTQITVTGLLLDATGAPLSGEGSFELLGMMRDTADKIVITPTRIRWQLNAIGQPVAYLTGSSLVLDATDDTTTLSTPSPMQYRLRATIQGSPSIDCLVAIPHASSGGTVDLSALLGIGSA